MKTFIGASIIGGVAAYSMQYAYNNLAGTNNQVAMIAGVVTAASVLGLKSLKVL